MGLEQFFLVKSDSKKSSASSLTDQLTTQTRLHKPRGEKKTSGMSLDHGLSPISASGRRNKKAEQKGTARSTHISSKADFQNHASQNPTASTATDYGSCGVLKNSRSKIFPEGLPGSLSVAGKKNQQPIVLGAIQRHVTGLHLAQNVLASDKMVYRP